MTIQERARQAAIDAISNNVNLSEVPFHAEIADAVAVEVLQAVEERITAKLAPALNTGTAMEALILVAEVLRGPVADLAVSETREQQQAVCQCVGTRQTYISREDVECCSDCRWPITETREQQEKDHGAALLRVDPSASPASTEGAERLAPAGSGAHPHAGTEERTREKARM